MRYLKLFTELYQNKDVSDLENYLYQIFDKYKISADDYIHGIKKTFPYFYKVPLTSYLNHQNRFCIVISNIGNIFDELWDDLQKIKSFLEEELGYLIRYEIPTDIYTDKGNVHTSIYKNWIRIYYEIY